MDIVYALGKGSVLKDFELKMSLRSVVKNLSGVDQIWIIGNHPEWLDTNHVNFIPLPDHSERVPDYNIMRKISCACEKANLSNDFIFFNDDHFLLSPFDTATFPYFYSGELENYIKRRGLDGYGRRANNTLKTLQRLGLPTKYFDIHTPIIYNKELFLKNVTSQDWNLKDGFIIKSLYANSLKIEGVEMKDNKINHAPQQGDRIFSTFPRLKASITRYLQEQFPEKSKYER